MRKIVVLSMVILLAGCQSWNRPKSTGKIEIGPDVRVSNDGEFPHVEPSIAVDPANPDRLIISSTVAHFDKEDGPNTRSGMRIYYSADGGRKWQLADVPELANIGGCNARLAFGPQGRGYFTTIGDGQKKQEIFTSEDGGAKWAITMNAGQRGDKPNILVDDTNSPYRGTIYVSVNLGNAFAIAASGDQGKTWNHLTYGPGPGDPPMVRMVDALAILPDGTLGVLYKEYRKKTDDDWDFDLRYMPFRQGGKQHDEPAIVSPRPFTAAKAALPGQIVHRGSSYMGDPSLAVDPVSGRFLAVWYDCENEINDLYWSRSDDRGKTWTPRQKLVPDAPAGSHRYQSAAAVNQEGVFGVFFLDTRDDPNVASYNGYFTASFDGGLTFLPPQKVTAAPSRPRQMWKKGFDSKRYTAGGDYSQMVTDTHGRFHPVWNDARHDGIQQLYTCTIKAVRD